MAYWPRRPAEPPTSTVLPEVFPASMSEVLELVKGLGRSNPVNTTPFTVTVKASLPLAARLNASTVVPLVETSPTFTTSVGLP